MIEQQELMILIDKLINYTYTYTRKKVYYLTAMSVSSSELSQNNSNAMNGPNVMKTSLLSSPKS